jgi:hypothetical protein
MPELNPARLFYFAVALLNMCSVLRLSASHPKELPVVSDKRLAKAEKTGAMLTLPGHGRPVVVSTCPRFLGMAAINRRLAHQ